MSSLAEAQTRLKPSLRARFSARRAPLAFALCLVAGLGVVAWRAKVRAETARAIARTEARAQGASVELQLSQASTAAEVLAMLPKQGRGGLANFQEPRLLLAERAQARITELTGLLQTAREELRLRPEASTVQAANQPVVESLATDLAHAGHERFGPSEIEPAWGESEKELRGLVVALKPVVQPKEDKPAPPRPLPAAPPVDPAQLRKAVNQMVPLLAERDPGAKDCLRDNRKTFRSGFTPEAYVEFEQRVKNGDSDGALEQLKKAARKHAISV